MVEMVEILDGRLGKRSVERVRYVINNLLHLVIVKYGDISLVLCISTRLRLVTILSLLVKYLVIFHADPCNKSYILHTQGWNISRGRRPREIFSTEGAIYTGISQGLGLNISFITWDIIPCLYQYNLAYNFHDIYVASK